jgi:urease accessory protein
VSPSPTTARRGWRDSDLDVEAHAPCASDKDLQRSIGSCRIVLRGSERGNQIVDLCQRSPVRVLFPQAGTAGIEEAVLINTSGGIAGGDRLDTAVTALADAYITLTSQAAERIYRALDQPSRISTTLVVANSAKLSWCPQETIVFDRARMNRQTHISVSSGAELLALEWIVLGRAAHGETVVSGEVIDSWRVERDGRLVWADCLRITDDVFPHVGRNALLADCSAVATLVYFGTDLEQRLECLRDWAAALTCHAAATMVGGLIVVRFAAPAASTLRAGLCSVLRQFDQAFGPGPFRVPKMWSC